MQLRCLQINTSSDHKDLPLELLAAVLQHLRQKDRLAASALVNKTWREAANMATTELSCFTAQKDFDSLLMWLKANKHASRIREIFVGDGMDSRVVFNLPADILVNLESLEIYPVCNLVVTSGATHHTEPSAAALPIAATSNTAATTAIITTAMSVEPCIVSISAFKALRKLELDMTHLDLSDLGRCTALQSLWLYLVNHLEPVSSPQAAEPLLTASCAAPISGLPALLASDEEEVTDSADSERYAAGGSTFKSSLDELDLLWHQEAGAGPEHEEEKVRYLPPQLVTALPQLNQLTSLSLHYSSCLRGEQYPAQPVTASLSSLQRLQGLEIDVEDFQGLDLTYLPINLTSLVMKGCYGSPSAVTLEAMPGLQYLVKLQQLSFSSASRLDAVLLSSLIQLTALHLSGCSFRSTMAVQQLMSGLQHLDKLKVLDLRSSLRQHAVAPEIYSAISASSELQRLNIDRCVFTPGAVEHIFPGAAILNSINELTAPADLFDDPGSLARMSASCPTLRRLEMNTSSEFCGSAWLGDWQVWILARVAYTPGTKCVT